MYALIPVPPELPNLPCMLMMHLRSQYERANAFAKAPGIPCQGSSAAGCAVCRFGTLRGTKIIFNPSPQTVPQRNCQPLASLGWVPLLQQCYKARESLSLVTWLKTTAQSPSCAVTCSRDMGTCMFAVVDSKQNQHGFCWPAVPLEDQLLNGCSKARQSPACHAACYHHQLKEMPVTSYGRKEYVRHVSMCTPL